MGVMITIDNNTKYCDQHGLCRHEVEPCICIEMSVEENVTPWANCPHCMGTGELQYKVRPFELNMSNGNFLRLWSDLMLGSDLFGSVDARVLSGRLGLPELSVRPATEEIHGENIVINGGVTYEQAHRYHKTLAAICDEAERREELVIWG